MADSAEAVSRTPASNLQTYGSYVCNPDADSVVGCDRYCSLVNSKDLERSSQWCTSAPNVSAVPRWDDFRLSDNAGIAETGCKIDPLCCGHCADVDGITSHPR